MSNEEITLRIEKLSEEIRRENAEHFARIAQLESSHTKWIIGILIAFCAITITLIKAIP